MKAYFFRVRGAVPPAPIAALRLTVALPQAASGGARLDPFSAPLAAEIATEVVNRSLTLNIVQEFGVGQISKFISNDTSQQQVGMRNWVWSI